MKNTSNQPIETPEDPIELLRGERQAGYYVEFVKCKKGENQHPPNKKGDFCIVDWVYCLLLDSLEASVDQVNYYGATYLSQDQLLTWIYELKKQMNEINETKNTSDLKRMIKNRRLGTNFLAEQKIDKNNWEKIKKSLAKVIHDSINMVKETLNENKELWILDI